MSTNINEIKTRISLRYDTYENWQKSDLKLYPGEVGFCTIPAGSTAATNAPTVLFKVGDGEHKFSDLKWVSATASDVYGWAKKSTIEEVPVKIGSGDNAETKTIQQWMAMVRQNAASIAELDIPSDTDIEDLISAALDKLSYTTPSAAATDEKTEFINTVTQTNGIISVTKAKLPSASTTKAGIVTLGVEGGAATFETVSELGSEVGRLKNAVSGGVHFIGVTTTVISDGSTTNPVKITGNTDDVTVAAGDIVLYGEKEFIWTGAAWEELGDLSQVGTLNTWRSGLKLDDTAVANEFVTAVSQIDGKISVTRIQPTTANILHSAEGSANTSLGAYLAQQAARLNKVDIADGSTVTTAIAGAIDALDYAGPTSYDTNTNNEVIFSVTQADGKVSAKKAKLPTATEDIAGIVTLGADGGAAKHEVAAQVSNIESDYVRYSDNKLYIGKNGTTEIIFNCGGAE